MLRRLLCFLQVFVLVVTLAWSPAASAIDPVMLLLMRMLRDKIATALADAAVEYALRPDSPEVVARPATLPGLPPPGMPEADRMRFIVDRNFTYLTRTERDQVYDALMAALRDPANEYQHGRIVEEFTRTALAVGEAQRLLETLSRSEKQEIASAAVGAFTQMPAAERQEFLTMLRTRQAPIPADLNAMLLEELGRL